MNKFLFSLLLIGSITYAGFYLYFKYNSAATGEMAPEIEAILSDGSTFKLSELRGKYVVLDFWGSWCAPCRIENPSLVSLHNDFKDKIDVVSIALEKNLNSVKLVAKKDGFSWRYQIIEETSLVMLSETARLYGVTSIPTKFLIDPDGNLLGEMSFDEIRSILVSIEE